MGDESLLRRHRLGHRRSWRRDDVFVASSESWMDVESTQSNARPQLDAEVTTRWLLRYRATKRTMLETPALDDRRSSRTRRPRGLGACARWPSFAVDPPHLQGDETGRTRGGKERDGTRIIDAADRAQDVRARVLVLVAVGSLRWRERSCCIGVPIERGRLRMRLGLAVPCIAVACLCVVVSQMLVKGSVRDSPCGLAESRQQQSEGDSVSPRTTHGKGRYPFSQHVHLRLAFVLVLDGKGEANDPRQTAEPPDAARDCRRPCTADRNPGTSACS